MVARCSLGNAQSACKTGFPSFTVLRHQNSLWQQAVPAIAIFHKFWILLGRLT
jgi:hypothetical protein